MSRALPELTTTSYAILGLLAVQPASTYELAKLMDRSLGRCWPRARSKLFEEPKKLAAHGLARASEEPVGRRPRTVYRITAKGRRALAAWLAEPGAGPVLEFEQLTKVFFSDHASKEVLVDTLAGIRRWADAERAEHAEVARSYLEGAGPFPQRTAVLVLTGRFLWDFAEAVAAWADWALDVVEGWPEDPSEAEPQWEALARIAEGVDQLPSHPPADGR